MTRPRNSEPRAAAKAKRGRGRPTIATPKIIEAILDGIANGAGLAQICTAPDMPARRTVHAWLAADTDFQHKYARAREAQGDFYADLATAVAKRATQASIGVARLQFDAFRWRAAKLAPKKWGDAVRHEHATDPDNPVAPAKTTVTFNIVRPPPIPEQYADELADLEPAK